MYFICFIDGSKAFDRINHGQLFVNWFQVKWDNVVSAAFFVSNGKCGKEEFCI